MVDDDTEARITAYRQAARLASLRWRRMRSEIIIIIIISDGSVRAVGRRRRKATEVNEARVVLSE
jgi:hypothetical protein